MANCDLAISQLMACYEQNHYSLYREAYRVLKDREAALDYVQDAFVHVLEYVKHGNVSFWDGTGLTYTRKVLWYALARVIRDAGRRPRFSPLEACERLDQEEAVRMWLCGDTSPTLAAVVAEASIGYAIDRQVPARLLLSRIREVLPLVAQDVCAQGLTSKPPSVLQAVFLRLLEGGSYEEIALVLNEKQTTIRAWICHLRRLLRDRLALKKEVRV